MIRTGYHDVTVHGTKQVCQEDGTFGPEEPWIETWLGARVLMIDDNGDAIVEHYPVGWRDVLRRIDRVPAADIGTVYTFDPIEIPESVQ